MKYVTQIEELIKDNLLEHFYLYENVVNSVDSEIEVNSKWVLQNENGWILGFSFNNNYSIYGLNYNEELIGSFLNQFDFNQIPDGHIFSGKKDLIIKLFDSNKKQGVAFEIYKERYFYKIFKNSLEQISPSDIKIEIATIDNLYVISEMNCAFFEEEYSGQNNKNINEVISTLLPHILDNKFYVAKDNIGNILGFVSKMNNKFNIEMIGTIYIDKSYRNKGIGRQLLYTITYDILKKQEETWLMTDVENKYSNIMVEKIGYKNIYNYTSGFLRKNTT